MDYFIVNWYSTQINRFIPIIYFRNTQKCLHQDKFRDQHCLEQLKREVDTSSDLLHTGTASLKINTSASPRKRMTDDNKP